MSHARLVPAHLHPFESPDHADHRGSAARVSFLATTTASPFSSRFLSIGDQEAGDDRSATRVIGSEVVHARV